MNKRDLLDWWNEIKWKFNGQNHALIIGLYVYYERVIALNAAFVCYKFFFLHKIIIIFLPSFLLELKLDRDFLW